LLAGVQALCWCGYGAKNSRIHIANLEIDMVAETATRCEAWKQPVKRKPAADIPERSGSSQAVIFP
jgi:hypothetical protein